MSKDTYLCDLTIHLPKNGDKVRAAYQQTVHASDVITASVKVDSAGMLHYRERCKDGRVRQFLLVKGSWLGYTLLPSAKEEEDATQ